MEFITLYNYSIIILLLPLIALAFFAVKFARNGWSRITMSLIFIMAIAVGFIIPNEFTSYPKPVSLEWMDRDLPEAQVLWANIDPDAEELHILLFWKNGPRLYKPKWDWDIAKELQGAIMDSRHAKELGGGGEITMAYPFLDSDERKKRLQEDGLANSEGAMEDRDMFRQPGVEEEDDSNVFHVAPPPSFPEKDPPKPPKPTIRT